MPNTLREKIIISEFGKGFVYNLILWMQHINWNGNLPESFKRMEEIIRKGAGYSAWFNGASDHLYELEIPINLRKKKVGKLAKQLQDLALDIGHGKRMTEESLQLKKDYKRAITLTKEIAFLIDKELGVNPIEADFQ